jgi:hypothetical protein
MLVLFLSILENDDERRRFTNIYEQYHEKMEQVAIRTCRNSMMRKMQFKTHLFR